MKTIHETEHTHEVDSMQTAIASKLDNPKQLEELYQKDKGLFKKVFNLMYPNVQHTLTSEVWYERLNYGEDAISWGTRAELAFVVLASLLATCIAKIPQMTAIDPDYFYPRNISFVVFPLLAAYFAWKQKVQTTKIVIVSVGMLLALGYINVLPNNPDSDTLILACMHLPLFLWALLGFTFVGDNIKDYQKRLDFLRYNGDMAVMVVLILIAGGLLTGITVGLFELIGANIKTFYGEYIVVAGLASAPIVSTYLVRSNPQLVNKVSPVIARVFTPLLFVTLVVYLIAIIYTGKDPYTDRDFLLIFNGLLIGVMAIILFSVAEITDRKKNKMGVGMLCALTGITLIVNGIALSAIVFRIAEWGITPNRLAVLGGNVLILTNLVIVSFRLFQTMRNQNEIESVENGIAAFLPIYSLWTTVVIFVFPLVFGFR